jgi:hypothetical protein
MAHLVNALPDKSLSSRFQLPIPPLEFYIHLSFRPHYGLAIDQGTHRNESQVSLLGIKAADA